MSACPLFDAHADSVAGESTAMTKRGVDARFQGLKHFPRTRNRFAGAPRFAFPRYRPTLEAGLVPKQGLLRFLLRSAGHLGGVLIQSRLSSPIAQSVERRTVNPQVPGSSPGRGAKKFKGLREIVSLFHFWPCAVFVTSFAVSFTPGRAPQTKSYLWAQMNGTGPPVRLFGYSPGRGTGHALKLYAGIAKGAVLMTDGYEVYNAIAATHGLVHLGCWVHCRRYFIEAEDVLPKEARTPDQPAMQFITAIGKLYAAEARARHADAAYRQRLRVRYSARVLRHIESLLLTYQPLVTPNSKLGRALAYLRGQWPKLTRHIENGSWPIDNNLCENAIRPFVVGRKGWLFADTVGGAAASANLYSLIETCKANNVDPYAYLIELLRALPLATTVDDYEALLPWKISLPATR